VLGGEILVEPGIATATRAPEICIEVVSPSNSVKEMEEKRAACLATGAHEVWIVYPQSKRCEFFGPQGPLERSAYPIDWLGVFA
jgi:Uma2 family endonuclease